MNDLSFAIPAAPAPAPSPDWDRLTAEVHCWRGAMIDLFAQAEAAVGEALHAAGHAGASLYLAGQRYDKLAALVGDGGPLALNGGGVRGELKAFRQLEDVRKALAHGVLTVTMGRDGRWTAIFHTAVFEKSGVQRLDVVHAQTEAEELRDRLARQVSRLCGQLTAMKRSTAK